MDGVARRGQQPGINLGIATVQAQVWLIPDLPIIHPAGKVFRGGGGKGGIGFDSFAGARVIKIRTAGQIAEYLKAMFLTLPYQKIKSSPLVFTLRVFNLFPGEILPSPIDARLLHRFQPGGQIRCSRVKGGVDAKG